MCCVNKNSAPVKCKSSVLPSKTFTCESPGNAQVAVQIHVRRRAPKKSWLEAARHACSFLAAASDALRLASLALHTNCILAYCIEAGFTVNGPIAAPVDGPWHRIPEGHSHISPSRFVRLHPVQNLRLHVAPRNRASATKQLAEAPNSP